MKQSLSNTAHIADMAPPSGVSMFDYEASIKAERRYLVFREIERDAEETGAMHRIGVVRGKLGEGVRRLPHGATCGTGARIDARFAAVAQW